MADLRIEEGKFYRTRDGRKVGPMIYRPERFCATFPFTVDHDIKDPQGMGKAWRENGTYSTKPEESPLDLIAEWIDEPASPVQTRTVAEIVPGTYGQIKVVAGHECSYLKLTDDFVNLHRGNALALRSMAGALTQIADALEQAK